jgi:tetratricopeptide (TPR) repeat protein
MRGNMLASCLVVLLLIFSSSAFAEQTATFEFNITKGIVSLDQQEYTEATQYLRAALKERPEDPSANLYLGIALINTGNEEEGEKLLKKALELEPLSPRTNLELGILYYKRGIHDEARDFFETVEDVASGTDLSDLAGDYIERIGERKVKVKDWSISLTGGFQYDSNVVLEPSDGTLPEGISRKSDWRGVIYIDGKFTPAITDNLVVGPTYSFYQSFHTKLSDFNVQQHLPGIILNYTFNRNFFFRALYTYEYTTVGTEEYLSAHSISPAIVIAEGEGFFTTLRYAYQNKDFKDSDLFENNSERDGSNNLAGITQYVPIGRVAILSLGYTYDHDTTDEDYWSYNGHKGNVDLRLDLGQKWFVDLMGEYYAKDYRDEYPGTGEKRQDDTSTFSSTLMKTIGSNFDITVGWQYVKNKSNIDIFEYERNIVTCLLRINL